MTYRELTPEEVVELVNPVMRDAGYAELSTIACRVWGAFSEDGKLVEHFVMQLIPMLGPMQRLSGSDNGTDSRALAALAEKFIKDSNVRGCIAIADSPVTERLCQRFGMELLKQPVYHFKA